MTDKQPDQLRLADALDLGHPLAEEAQQAAVLLRTQHAEIERLNACIKWEQSRAERIGTHGPGCHLWGPSHHECLLREYANQRGEFASQVERLNAAATDSNLILERAQATNLEMLAAIERKDALLRQALETLCCETSENMDDPGHRCGHCDDYVDRNGTLRSAITKELSQ